MINMFTIKTLHINKKMIEKLTCQRTEYKQYKNRVFNTYVNCSPC